MKRSPSIEVERVDIWTEVEKLHSHLKLPRHRIKNWVVERSAAGMVFDMNQILSVLGQESQLLDTSWTASVVHSSAAAIIFLVRISIVI